MRRAIYLFVIICLTFSCKKEDIKIDFDNDEFLLMKYKWEQLSIKDYSFKYTFSGLGCVANDYLVEDGLLVEIHPDTLICIHIDTTEKYTIDSVFQIIENRYKNPYLSYYSKGSYFYCNEIKIEYDLMYFFPKKFEFKYKGKNMDITDTENYQTITNFKTR